MSRTRTIPTGWLTVTANVADPGDNGFTPATGWMDGNAVQSARCVVRVRNLTGNIELTPAIELANHPRDTTTKEVQDFLTSANFITAEGITDPATFHAVTDVKQLFRLGWVTRNASGTSLSTCEVQGAFEVKMADSAPAIQAPWMTVISDDTVTATFFPGTQWVDAMSAERLRAVLEVAAREGDIDLQPAYQLANDPTNPDAAVAFGNTVSADGVDFPGAFTSPASDGKQLIRLGWSAILGSGSSPAWARVAGTFIRLTE